MSEDEDETFRVITIRHRPERSEPKRRVPFEKYEKTGPTMQDMISENVDMFRSKLENYEAIAEKDYDDIETGTFIRYVTYDKTNTPKLRLGGYLITNKAPKYWVLRSGSKGKQHVSWSVNLQANPRNILFKRKGVATKTEQQQHAKEAYEALASGKYHLVPKSMLQTLTGGGGGTSMRHQQRTKMIDDEQEEYDDEEFNRPKIKVNFTQE